MKKIYRKDTTCQNCGTMVDDKYCPHCGQENIELHVPVWGFIIHLVGDFFHFDSKFFRTVFPLIFRPGKLTREYLNGKRRTYLDPLRMYVFVSIIFFSINAIYGGDSRAVKISNSAKTDSLSAETGNIINFKDSGDLKIDSTGNKMAKMLLGILKSKYEKAGNNSKEFNEQLIHKNSGNFAKAMFLLLPIFAWILSLFFRRRHYVDHAVFALHIHTATFIFLTLLILIAHVVSGYALGLLVTGYMLIYLLLSIKRVYNVSWRYTFFSFAGISIIYGILMSMTYLLSVFISLLML